MNNGSIPDQLAQTLTNTDKIHLPAEIFEFSVDQILDDGLLKEIPFVGWIEKGIKLSLSISDKILFHKILRFLYALDKKTPKAQEDFKNKIASDIKFRRKVGEHLLLLLNRIDDFEKPDMVAKCFEHYLSGYINHDHFMALSHIIERSMTHDLKSLIKPVSHKRIFKNYDTAVSSGIMYLDIGDPDEDSGKQELYFKFTSYGNDLFDILNDQYKNREERHRHWIEKGLPELHKALSRIRSG